MSGFFKKLVWLIKMNPDTVIQLTELIYKTIVALQDKKLSDEERDVLIKELTDVYQTLK